LRRTSPRGEINRPVEQSSLINDRDPRQVVDTHIHAGSMYRYKLAPTKWRWRSEDNRRLVESNDSL